MCQIYIKLIVITHVIASSSFKICIYSYLILNLSNMTEGIVATPRVIPTHTHTPSLNALIYPKMTSRHSFPIRSAHNSSYVSFFVCLSFIVRNFIHRPGENRMFL